MQLLHRDRQFQDSGMHSEQRSADLLVERLAAPGLTVDQLLRLNARSRETKNISPSACENFLHPRNEQNSELTALWSLPARLQASS
jgi:preprotein translocase subunit Sec63